MGGMVTITVFLGCAMAVFGGVSRSVILAVLNVSHDDVCSVQTGTFAPHHAPCHARLLKFDVRDMSI